MAGYIGPFRFSVAFILLVYTLLSVDKFQILPFALLISFSTYLLRLVITNFLPLSPEMYDFILTSQFSFPAGIVLLAVLLALRPIRKRTGDFSLALLFYLILVIAISILVEALVRLLTWEVVRGFNILFLLFASILHLLPIIALLQISFFQRGTIIEEQQRILNEKMLIIASELYDEQFYMQKSVENIENIMAKSYTLHKKLKDLKLADRNLESDALEVAEEVHEVKKDTVRVLAGIGEVITIRRDKSVMNLNAVFDLVIKTNRSYAQSLEKNVDIILESDADIAVTQIYPLLAILNNLVSNAVEAIIDEGMISLKAKRSKYTLRISVCDNGEPIRESNRTLIFEPGFTTKFNADGVPSTGIGLSYIKGLVENFKGRVFFTADGSSKCFIIILPLKSLTGGL